VFLGSPSLGGVSIFGAGFAFLPFPPFAGFSPIGYYYFFPFLLAEKKKE
jgi:hypothetical protein